MRKILVLLLCFCLVFALFACKKGENGETTASNGAISTTAADDWGTDDDNEVTIPWNTNWGDWTPPSSN